MRFQSSGSKSRLLCPSTEVELEVNTHKGGKQQQMTVTLL